MGAKNKIMPGDILPADTFFYTIPFEEPGQRITRDLISKHYPFLGGRKVYMGNQVNYISYSKGIVTIQVILNDKSEHVIYLHVGLEELHVACSCGMPTHELCFHAYMGLNRLCWQHYLELSHFYWPGVDADEKRRSKFLKVDANKNRINVDANPKFGNIFKQGIGFKDAGYLTIKEPDKLNRYPLNADQGNKEAIAYVLCYNLSVRCGLSFPPILIPCLGTTSKDGKQMLSFKQFGRRDKPVRGIEFTGNQARLNEISYRQYEIAVRYDVYGSFDDKQYQLHKRELFKLWQEALPLLMNEKYNYAYYTYWLRYLKSKPRKTDMRPCRYSLDTPVISFILKFHQNHFSLTCSVTLDGTVLPTARKPHFFVFDKKAELSFLIPSVEDDDVVMWMGRHDNRLTVLKEHFTEFHLNFLDRLSRSYDVFFFNSKGLKLLYQYKNLLQSLFL